MKEQIKMDYKDTRDIKNVVDTSFEEGIEEGKKEERILIAKELIKNGVSLEIVMKSTGLTKQEIENL